MAAMSSVALCHVQLLAVPHEALIPSSRTALRSYTYHRDSAELDCRLNDATIQLDSARRQTQ